MEELLKEAKMFENFKLRSLSTSERIEASREAKRLILEINEIYKKTKKTELMELMKRLTVKKKKIEYRLRGRI